MAVLRVGDVVRSYVARREPTVPPSRFAPAAEARE